MPSLWQLSTWSPKPSIAAPHPGQTTRAQRIKWQPGLCLRGWQRGDGGMPACLGESLPACLVQGPLPPPLKQSTLFGTYIGTNRKNVYLMFPSCSSCLTGAGICMPSCLRVVGVRPSLSTPTRIRVRRVHGREARLRGPSSAPTKEAIAVALCAALSACKLGGVPER